MSIGREILEETKKINEAYKVPATFYNSEGETSGVAGQINASFIAVTDQGDTVYHKMIDWCNSIEELREYSGQALKDLIDFIDTTDYYINVGNATVMGLMSTPGGSSANYKVIGSWDIYRDGEYTDELSFAKDALGYDN